MSPRQPDVPNLIGDAGEGVGEGVMAWGILARRPGKITVAVML
jgi:hypothetical protein